MVSFFIYSIDLFNDETLVKELKRGDPEMWKFSLRLLDARCGAPGILSDLGVAEMIRLVGHWIGIIQSLFSLLEGSSVKLTRVCTKRIMHFFWASIEIALYLRNTFWVDQMLCLIYIGVRTFCEHVKFAFCR